MLFTMAICCLRGNNISLKYHSFTPPRLLAIVVLDWVASLQVDPGRRLFNTGKSVCFYANELTAEHVPGGTQAARAIHDWPRAMRFDCFLYSGTITMPALWRVVSAHSCVVEYFLSIITL